MPRNKSSRTYGRRRRTVVHVSLACIALLGLHLAVAGRLAIVVGMLLAIGAVPLVRAIWRRQDEAERFDELAAQSRTFVWEVDQDGLYTYVSHVVEAVLGYRPEELVGKLHFYDLHPEASREEFRDQAFAVFRALESFRGFENVAVTRDGRLAWLSTTGVPLIDARGRLRGYRGSDLDISDRKHAEAELALTRERLELAIAGSRDGIWDWDLRDGSLFLSPRWKEQLGYLDDELPSEFASFLDRIHPDDKARVTTDVEQYRTGETAQYETEFRMRHRDGSYRWILARGAAVRDESGQPLRMAGSHTDITVRRLADEALRESEDRLGSLLSSMQDLVFVLDGQLVFRSIHPSRQNDLLSPPERFVGRYLHEIGLPDDALRHVEAAIGQTLGSGEAALVEYWLDRPTGRQWYELCATPYGVRADQAGLVTCVVRNTTDRKLAEEELRKANRQLEEATVQAQEMTVKAEMASRAKSEFLANMSHEIRTPMNGVIGMTGLLLDMELGPEQRRYAEKVRTSAEALLGLINDILDFSKIEAGKLEFEMMDFDLGDILAGVVETLALPAQVKGLRLASSPAHDAPTLLRGDPGRLRQVLLNLAGNAVKFTDTGEVVIRAEFVDGSQTDALLRFTVRDTGPGIAPDQHQRLFEKFSQVDGSATRRHGGTGLGLSIARKLVEMMGGEIGVISEPGRGSEFWFTARFETQRIGGRSGHLPSHSSTNTAATESTEGAASVAERAAAARRCARVLVAEDNPINQQVARGLLRKLGVSADTVANGNEAIEALAAIPYDLVLMDVQMPELDGLEATRRIRDPRTGVLNHRIPIIAMTAHAMVGDREICFAAGMNDYVTKPVSVRIFAEALDRWLPTVEASTSADSDFVVAR